MVLLVLEVQIRFRLLIAAAAAALTFAPLSGGATARQLHAREQRQVRSLHRRVGTVRFFASHPRLARTRAGRRALRVARVWVPIVRRELAETRAQLRPRYAVPAWWLRDALCVHRGESGNWHIVNPPYANGLQFTLATWISVGGTAANWASASPGEQLWRGYLLWKLEGWRPWPVTSRACGLS